VPKLRFAGCRSRPLIGYLKALGLFRVVARQADGAATARWSDGAIEISSALDRDGLDAFLSDEYTPAPVVSPWNGGSGFHPKDKAAARALAEIERRTEARWDPLQGAIRASRAALARVGLTDKPQGSDKLVLLRELRATLDDDAVEWLDAAVVLAGDDPRFPPLLGSGGNDGRFDFGTNFAQAALRALCGDGDSAGWLRAALDRVPAPLLKMSTAHFERDASPVNSPLGEADALGNPWDLLLAVEGSLVLAAGVGRRHDESAPGNLVAPFTAAATAAGYGSATSGESGRAEVWLPLWHGWSSFPELEVLVREARAQVGRRQARSGLDFVRAAGALGVARGIDAFERFAILERAGQSSLAVAAGRVDVRARPAAEALQSLDAWLERVLRYGRGSATAGPRAAIQRLERAAFALADTATPTSACAFLERLGELESALAVSGATLSALGVRPPSGVPAEPWLRAANDGTPEFAVAVAIGSLHDQSPSRGRPAVRDYLHGTGVEASGRRSYDVRAAWSVARRAAPPAVLAAVHARRHLDAHRASERTLLAFDAGLSCDWPAISLLATGQLDDGRVLRLVRGLCLLDHRDAGRSAPREHEPVAGRPLPALELLALAWHGDAEAKLGARPGWAARLASGWAPSVLRDALLRLRLADHRPLLDGEDLERERLDARRLSAALLIRPRKRDMERMTRRLTEKAEEPANTANEGAE
jgi:CRISPR-associated protein Csx17